MFRKVKIDPYFFIEHCQMSGKPRINTKKIKWACTALGLACLVTLLFMGSRAETKDQPASNAKSAQSASSAAASALGVNHPSNGSPPEDPFVPGGYGGTRARSATAARQYTASQIVGKGSGQAFAGAFLPIGTTIAARLLNRVLSSDSASPVIAEIAADIEAGSGTLIPEGTKAFGNAGGGDSGDRLQVRFHTLVYPNGSQHPISAMALLSDGSAGLTGDYHSEFLRRRGGSFLGNFVAGLAEGMKDKEAGPMGITIEPGSLRNGVLNGLATSSLDQAKSTSEDLSKVHPYLEVQSGASFLIYLEKEYTP